MQSVRQLTQQFQPSHYDLKLTLEREQRRFNGTVIIKGSIPTASNTITLHAKDLQIKKAVSGSHAATPSQGENDELTLTFDTELKAGEHTITLEFDGTITDSLHGLYPCYYQHDGKDKEILATQFESHHAREVFPCIDEPAAKATFDLTLTTEDDVEVIANTPISSQKHHKNTLTTTFATTPKMSTYLLAFVVGEFEYLEAKTRDGVVVRTYATPGQEQFTAFPLEVAVRALEFYNDFFGIAYPLQKCDLIGIPDFSAGAMENWGCITFREDCYLVDDANSDVSTKQFAAQVVIHELAHQWFGNLVTMQWWNDLWLNEGFARFMESFVADKLFPDWNLKTDFIASNIAVAQRLDALENTHPIQVDIHHPDEISTIFDSISYEKGAASIQMLHQYIGEEAFRQGLSHYLKKHEYANTVTDDLWNAFSEAAGKDVRTFMHQWITQPGFPVVTIEETENQLLFTQKRFFGNPANTDKEQLVWPVPLLAGDAELPELLTTQTTATPKPTTSPFKINRGQTGFYFTAYSASQLAELKQAVSDGKLDVDDRLGLLHEIFELAHAGSTTTVDALRFLEAFENEKDNYVWDVIASNLSMTRTLIDEDTAALEAFNNYIRRLVMPLFKQLGWEGSKDEALRIRSLRQTVIALACRAEEPSIIHEALQRFHSATKPEDIPADLRPYIYAAAARHGDKETVKLMLERHRHTTFSEERSNLTVGATDTIDLSALPMIFEFIKTEVKSQDVIRWFVYLIRNRVTREAAWQWMVDEWPWITETFSGDKSYDRFAKYSAGAHKTERGLDIYKAFFDEKKQDPSLTRAINQAIESIEIRVAWHNRDFEAVKDYLVTSSIQSVTRN